MAQLIVYVVDNPEKTDDVVDTWIALGVPGITILNSSGIGRASHHQGLGDDLPLMLTLSSLLRSREAPHSTLFSIIPDDFNLDNLAEATQKITGELDEPNTGILFVVPVTHVWETVASKIKR